MMFVSMLVCAFAAIRRENDFIDESNADLLVTSEGSFAETAAEGLKTPPPSPGYATQFQNELKKAGPYVGNTKLVTTHTRDALKAFAPEPASDMLDDLNALVGKVAGKYGQASEYVQHAANIERAAQGVPGAKKAAILDGIRSGLGRNAALKKRKLVGPIKAGMVIADTAYEGKDMPAENVVKLGVQAMAPKWAGLVNGHLMPKVIQPVMREVGETHMRPAMNAAGLETPTDLANAMGMTP